VTDTETLAELLGRLARDVAAEHSSKDGAAAGYSREGRPFAFCEGEVVELRLHPDVAAAAVRTNDTTASDKGSGWVRVAPSTVDRFVLDRVESWFLSAWRAASDDA